ncbi:MAG: hypothetical protein OYH76_18320 [Defluviicoccus sp.]|nr:hypothetical protein [Defluviicoccus sp.]MDE0277854.1 hypothetical protein [Defluviicoccus sp.]
MPPPQQEVGKAKVYLGNANREDSDAKLLINQLRGGYCRKD